MKVTQAMDTGPLCKSGAEELEGSTAISHPAQDQQDQFLTIIIPSQINSSHWFCGFCSSASTASPCCTHGHAVLKSQPDLQLFGKRAPAYLNSLGKTATRVVCVSLSVTPFARMLKTQQRI